MCVKIFALQSFLCPHYQNQSSHQKEYWTCFRIQLNLQAHTSQTCFEHFCIAKAAEPTASLPRPRVFRILIHHKPFCAPSSFEAFEPLLIWELLYIPVLFITNFLQSIFTARTFEHIWIPSSFEPSMHFAHLCLSFFCILKLQRCERVYSPVKSAIFRCPVVQ